MVNPNSGSITGGGWITSPQGAYVEKINLTGKASFGFVSQYKKGMTIPTGETTFQFQVAGLTFKSTKYSWLVVNGDCAEYRGYGTVNGDEKEDDFILTACDKITGDTFHIQIFGVYDDLMKFTNEADITSYAGTVIGG